jgi:hypothetical protein
MQLISDPLFGVHIIGPLPTPAQAYLEGLKVPHGQEPGEQWFGVMETQAGPEGRRISAAFSAGLYDRDFSERPSYASVAARLKGYYDHGGCYERPPAELLSLIPYMARDAIKYANWLDGTPLDKPE